MKYVTLTLYTINGTLEFDIIVMTENYINELAEALDTGTIVADTVEGTKLILNGMNVVAVEITERTAQTPPVSL